MVWRQKIVRYHPMADTPGLSIQKGRIMRHSLIIGASIMLGCLLIGLMVGRSTMGQAPGSTTPGRYQIFSTDRQGASARVIMCDTATGQCWEHRIEGKPWTDLGSPFVAAKAKTE